MYAYVENRLPSQKVRPVLKQTTSPALPIRKVHLVQCPVSLVSVTNAYSQICKKHIISIATPKRMLAVTAAGYLVNATNSRLNFDFSVLAEIKARDVSHPYAEQQSPG